MAGVRRRGRQLGVRVVVGGEVGGSLVTVVTIAISGLLKVYLSEDCLRGVVLSAQRNTRRVAPVGPGTSWPLLSVVAFLVVELAFIVVFPTRDTLAALRLDTFHFALAAHITRCYDAEALLALAIPLRLLVNELHRVSLE